MWCAEAFGAKWYGVALLFVEEGRVAKLKGACGSNSLCVAQHDIRNVDMTLHCVTKHRRIYVKCFIVSSIFV